MARAQAKLGALCLVLLTGCGRDQRILEPFDNSTDSTHVTRPDAPPETGGTGGDEPSADLSVSVSVPSTDALNGVFELVVIVSGGHGVPQITLLIEGEAPWTKNGTPAVYQVNTCNLKDGEHTFVIIVEDAAGATTREEIQLTIANAEVPPRLKGTAGDGVFRLDWQQCGQFHDYRLFWGTEAGITETDATIDAEGNYWLHRPNQASSTFFYRIAPVVDSVLGRLSNEVALTSQTTDQRVCSDDGWCWDTGPPQGADLTSIWSSDDNNVVTSATGATIHFDGLRWRRIKTTYSNLKGQLWGTSYNDLWRASSGILEHFDGEAWTLIDGIDAKAIWGTDKDHVWVHDYDGLRFFDGREWSLLPAGALDQFHPQDLWATDEDDLWVAANGVYGARGGLLHFNGQEWDETSSGWEKRAAIWGTAPDDVWSVGEHGQILHYDGSSWQISPSGVVEDLADVHGCSEDDVWAVGDFGTVLNWDGTSWKDRSPPSPLKWEGVICNGSGTVWIAGERGETLRFDGTWSTPTAEKAGPLRGVVMKAESPLVSGEYETLLQRQASGWVRLQGTREGEFPNITLWDMHGTGPDDVWAVGDSGVIVHKDGDGWELLEPVVGHNLKEIWANSVDDVWATGNKGVMVHFDGERWTPHSAGYTSYVHDIWGSGPDDVWVAGFDNLIHWNGVEWIETPRDVLPSGNAPVSLWGTGSNDLWSVTAFDHVAHWDGTSWTAVNTGHVGVNLGMIHGSGPEDIWISGWEDYLHYDGSTWSRTKSTATRRGIWVLSPDRVWSGGSNPSLWNGQDWIAGPGVPSVRTRMGLWAADATNVYSYGEMGSIFSFNGSVWEPELPASREPMHLGDMWLESEDSIWLIGDYGTIRHFNGAGWESHDSGTWAQLFSIDAIDGDDIWVSGEAGTMLHYDGSSWESVDSGTAMSIRGVWASPDGVVWAAGGNFPGSGISYNGTILRWDGDSWGEVDIPNVPTLTDIWGTSHDDIWAVGESTTILHYDGSKWTDASPVGSTTLVSVWGISPSKIWTVGTSGSIWHFDGTTWTLEQGPGAETLLAVGGDEKTIWAVGDRGTIWRQDAP